MPNLIALDCSFNLIVSTSSVIDSLISLSSLKSLWLDGNPCSLQRRYRWIIADDLHSLDYIDGVRVSKNEDDDKENKINDITSVMDLLFKEDREKAAKLEAEKNVKKGPAAKDPKAKVVEDKTKKDDKTKKAPEPEKPKLQTLGSMEIHMNPLSKFPIDPDVKVPYRIMLSVKVLEKINAVFFEDVAEDPAAKKEDFMSCFWLELVLSIF